MIGSQPVNNFESIMSFVNNKISCNTHTNQAAKSICIDCKTFCCMLENCGQPHIYHSIENLEYLVNLQVFPFLTTLKDMNEFSNQSRAKNMNSLNLFKNNLKKFAIDEKKQIDEEYRNILQSLNTIYNSHMDDINEFIVKLGSKFDSLQQKIVSLDNDPNIKSMNSYLNDLILKCQNSNQIFLSLIAKDVKEFNNKLKGTNSQILKFDFVKEINEIKTEAEKFYPNVEKKDYYKNLRLKFEEEMNGILLNKKKRENKLTLNKINKVVTMRQSSILPKDNIHLDLDLDIFVRYLNEEINKIRLNPLVTLKLLDEHLDLMNNNYLDNDESILNQTINMNANMNLNETGNWNTNINNKLAYIYEYVNQLACNKMSFAPLEWDNDLSNSAEDYLKISHGKIEKDFNLYLTSMKEIINNNYYASFKNFNSLIYRGLPQINKIIIQILLNEKYWDSKTKHNALFDANYNVIGICGITSDSSNKINLILNLSYLKN